MAVLDSKIQDQIDALSNAAYDKLQEKAIEEGLALYEQAWNTYPAPQNKWNEAYNTAKYAAKNCIRLSDFENAKEWLNRMIEVNNNLHQSDEELKFYIGMYLFETGDFKEALDKFQFVVKEAGMRYFSSADKKYLDFYKHPEKHIG